MSDSGWIPAFRKMFADHWLAPNGHDPASRLHAWLDLCQMATHKQRQTRYVTLERGQFIGAVRVLAKRWYWSKSAVQRFLDDLVLRDTIGTVCGTPDGKVYRIVKYEDYAGQTTDVGDSVVAKGGTAAGHEQELKKKQPTTTTTRLRRGGTWRFCPAEWEPKESHRLLARQLGVDLLAAEAKFRDHEYKSPKTDADRAFSTWLRNTAEWGTKPNGNGHKPTKYHRLLPDPT